jgi:hypothetical protein
LEPALVLFTGFLAFSEEEELDEEELEAALFLVATFLSSAFLFLFLVSSIETFLDGASDEEAEAFF